MKTYVVAVEPARRRQQVRLQVKPGSSSAPIACLQA